MIHIVAGMNGNFHDPGLDTALAMKTIQSPVYLHKRFLHSILRQCLVAQVEETHPQYRSLILRYQFFKIRVLSFVRALDNAHVLSPPSLIQTDEQKKIFHFSEKSSYEYAAQKTEKLPGGMFQLTGRIHFRGHFIQGRIFRVLGFLQHHRWKDQSGLDK